MGNRNALCPLVIIGTLPAAFLPNLAGAQQYTAWNVATAVAEVNSVAADGCPIESPDGLSLYIASMRAGTLGGNDIWASDRASKSSAWSEPQNLGAPVNTAANDFCPTPLGNGYLMFVSERAGAETCNAGPGSGDIYQIRQNASFGWGEPQHLGCMEAVAGPNSNGAEFSPSLVRTSEGTYLYFSSTSSGNMDIYRSLRGARGSFGPPEPVAELNTAFDDRMPNVTRDGLEVVFSSNRRPTQMAPRDSAVSTFTSPPARASTTHGRHP